MRHVSGESAATGVSTFLDDIEPQVAVRLRKWQRLTATSPKRRGREMGSRREASDALIVHTQLQDDFYL